MSHRLFLDSIFSSARVWAVLKQVDEAEAARFCTARLPRPSAGLLRPARQVARALRTHGGRLRKRAKRHPKRRRARAWAFAGYPKTEMWCGIIVFFAAQPHRRATIASTGLKV